MRVAEGRVRVDVSVVCVCVTEELGPAAEVCVRGGPVILEGADMEERGVERVGVELSFSVRSWV
jgi:hypothetical protein